MSRIAATAPVDRLEFSPSKTLGADGFLLAAAWLAVPGWLTWHASAWMPVVLGLSTVALGAAMHVWMLRESVMVDLVACEVHWTRRWGPLRLRRRRSLARYRAVELVASVHPGTPPGPDARWSLTFADAPGLSLAEDMSHEDARALAERVASVTGLPVRERIVEFDPAWVWLEE